VQDVIDQEDRTRDMAWWKLGVVQCKGNSPLHHWMSRRQ
jgi:hypothetical protein